MAAIVQDLSADGSGALLAEVVPRNIPVTIEIKVAAEWLRYKSRFLSLMRGRNPYLWLERPQSSSEDKGSALRLGDRLVVNFTWAHERYRFAAVVIQNGQFRLAGGRSVEGFTATWPGVIQRVQRRSAFRYIVPATQRIDATIWQGGLALRDMVAAGCEPCFHGRVRNLSMGGLCLQLHSRPAPCLRVGEHVAVEFRLAPGQPSYAVEAVVRRFGPNADGAVEVGLQFVGSAASADWQRCEADLAPYIVQAERESIRRSRLTG